MYVHISVLLKRKKKRLMVHHNDIVDTSCILMHNLIRLKGVTCHHKLMPTSMLLFCLMIFFPFSSIFICLKWMYVLLLLFFSFKLQNIWLQKGYKNGILSCQTHREIFAMFDSEIESLSVKCIVWHFCYTFQICLFPPTQM